MKINDFKDIFIKLFKGRTLTLINVLYVLKIIVNLINVAFLNEKKIEVYFLFNKSAYLNYFDQHVIFANNVHKQYLLKIDVNMIMSFRERQLKQQKF